jgi:hypothetical protein
MFMTQKRGKNVLSSVNRTRPLCAVLLVVLEIREPWPELEFPQIIDNTGGKAEEILGS